MSPPAILRPGPLSATALAAALGETLAAPTTDPLAPARSPGQAARHYAPRTPLEISPCAAERVSELLRAGKRVGWLTTRAADARTRRIATSAEVVVVPMPDDPVTHAAMLYAVLHAIDKRSLDWIIVDEPPAGDDWQAIHDRLTRAATPDEAPVDDDASPSSSA